MNAAKHTPGPWRWFGDPKHGSFYLATVHGGRRYVMDFGRLGMRHAQPRFQVEGLMVPASELCTFEVGERGVIGYQAARANPSVYRYDITGIDHPDARLMEEAPELLGSLEDVVRAWLHEANQGDGIMDEHAPILAKARAVIAKAKGEA